ADDRRVDRRRLCAESLAGGASLEHDENLFVYAGTDAVDCENGRPARRIVGVQRLNQQQLRAFELRVLLRRHNGTHHAPHLHQPRSQWSTMPTMPASTGGSAGRNGKLASLPRTKNTYSPTPAPTASTATRGRP